MSSDEERVREWLQHIIENSDRVALYLGDMTYEQFRGETMVRDAVERCLERITEASIRIGRDLVDNHSRRSKAQEQLNQLDNSYEFQPEPRNPAPEAPKFVTVPDFPARAALVKVAHLPTGIPAR